MEGVLAYSSGEGSSSDSEECSEKEDAPSSPENAEPAPAQFLGAPSEPLPSAELSSELQSGPSSATESLQRGQKRKLDAIEGHWTTTVMLEGMCTCWKQMQMLPRPLSQCAAHDAALAAAAAAVPCTSRDQDFEIFRKQCANVVGQEPRLSNESDAPDQECRSCQKGFTENLHVSLSHTQAAAYTQRKTLINSLRQAVAGWAGVTLELSTLQVHLSGPGMHLGTPSCLFFTGAAP
jgi:Uncharacterised conserved protein